MMHDGCNGSFANGAEVVAKVRFMGFAEQMIPMALQISCVECGKEFEMETFEDQCPHCGMVYGVTPCSTSKPERIQAAGKDY